MPVVFMSIEALKRIGYEMKDWALGALRHDPSKASFSSVTPLKHFLVNNAGHGF